jgi:hypothetical protein
MSWSPALRRSQLMPLARHPSMMAINSLRSCFSLALRSRDSLVCLAVNLGPQPSPSCRQSLQLRLGSENSHCGQQKINLSSTFFLRARQGSHLSIPLFSSSFSVRWILRVWVEWSSSDALNNVNVLLRRIKPFLGHKIEIPCLVCSLSNPYSLPLDFNRFGPRSTDKQSVNGGQIAGRLTKSDRRSGCSNHCKVTIANRPCHLLTPASTTAV